MRTRTIVWLTLALALTTAYPASGGAGERSSPPSLVLKHPQPEAALAARVDWALSRASERGFEKGFWAGYSIRIQMGEHSSIGHMNWPRDPAERSLAEVLAGRTVITPPMSAEASIREAARQALEEGSRARLPEKTSEKDLAILVRYSGGREPRPAEIVLSNLDLPVSFEALPLVWLGPAGEPDSLAQLKALYGRSADAGFKEDTIFAFACHKIEAATDFLIGEARGPNTAKIRQAAVEGLAEKASRRISRSADPWRICATVRGAAASSGGSGRG
ncbi:MAG: hypothetical protein WCI75_20250 [candidate division NC10 bacterium]